MKIFEKVRKHYAALGISPSNPSTQKYPNDKRILFGFVILGCVIVPQFLYIFYVDNNFMDYMETICGVSACIIISICFASVASKKSLLFENISKLEMLIDTSNTILRELRIYKFKVKDILLESWQNSNFLGCKHPKSRRFFLETNQKMERLSEMVFTVVKIALHCYTLPTCIFSFITYFIVDDSENDSFQLPYSMW